MQVSSQKSSLLPSYLYIKNGIYYYRACLPKMLLPNLPQRYVRVSLKTGYKRQASSMARKIHEYLDTVYHVLLLHGSDKTTQQKMAFVRDEVKKFVKDLLAEQNKAPINMRDARLRLNGYLKYQLDKDAADDVYEEYGEITTNEKGEKIEKIIPRDTLYDEEAKILMNAVNTFENDYVWSIEAINELVKREIFDREEIDQNNFRALARLFLKTQAIFSKAIAEKLRGNLDEEQKIYAAESIDYPREKINKSNLEISEKNVKRHKPKKEKQPTLLLSQLIEKYCSTQIADKKWRPNMLIEHRGRVNNIVDILGDKAAAEVNREDMRKVKDILPKLPVSRKRKPEYRDKTIQELLKMKPKETISIPTANKIIQAISAMYEWGIREGILKENPAKGLKTIDPEAAIDKRAILSDTEIQKVFFSGDYTLSAFKNNQAYFWCPLIGLYSGMRLEEICQLHCEDIYQKEDVWIFDIKTTSTDGLNDKTLKTKNAIRQVPIHDKLIDLGLLDYLNKQHEKKEIRLFPQLKKSVNSKYGKQVGKHFTRFLNSKGIEGKSFHSLRHSFANFFKIRGLQDDVFRQVFGHEIGELASNTYGERFSPKLCYDRVISKLDYADKNMEG